MLPLCRGLRSQATRQNQAGEMLLWATLVIFLGSLVLFKLYLFDIFFFWHTYQLPGTVLGTWDIQANKRDEHSCLCEAYIPLGMGGL